MGRSGRMCPRCGGVERIQVSATESRCAECGLGSTSVPLVAISDPATIPNEQEGIARLQAMMGQQAQRFETASFSPFALDERWDGVRSFGGWGGSNDQTVRLSLAHGNPFDHDSALVRVETRRPRPVGLDGPGDPRLEHADLTKELVRGYRDLTGSVPENVRAAAFPYQVSDAFAKDPTALWDEASILVDGVPVAFKVLTGDASWVALAPVGDLFIGITSRRWLLEDTGLVPVTEFGTYADGSTENAARARRRHTEAD